MFDNFVQTDADKSRDVRNALNPLHPAFATIGTGTFLVITRQSLQLESCSNPRRMPQVF